MLTPCQNLKITNVSHYRTQLRQNLSGRYTYTPLDNYLSFQVQLTGSKFINLYLILVPHETFRKL